ncbi:MAG: plastocyanin/azurin family copper-binding protein [Mariprofundaceae bacterium]|nr:plastocyanin/azurin family copper-binding protein [Mariprofundaceae bacterium]
MNIRMTITSMLAAWALFGFVPVATAHEDEVSTIITEEDIEYTPEEQVVHVGHPIRVVNKDPFEHKSRVTEQLVGGGLGHIALKDHIDKPGTSYTFKLDKPGTYEIRCLIHDGMTATIKAIQ